MLSKLRLQHFGYLICSLVLFSSLGSATGSEAATYYTATTGDDARSCGTAQSVSTPKRTVVNAARCLTAGDTLLIRAGTYTEDFAGNGFTAQFPSGTSGNPVTLKAYRGETVVWKDGSPGREEVIFLPVTAHDITFDGITVDAAGVSLAGVYIYNDATNAARNITFQNGEVKKGSTGKAMQLFLVGCKTTGIVIRNNLLHDNGDPSTDSFGGAHAVYGEGTGMVIDGNTIYNISGYGLHIHADPPNPGQADCYRNIPDTTMTRNIIHDAGTSGFGGSGILCSSCSGTTLIANNILYNNLNSQSCGVQLYYNISGMFKVYNNTVYNSKGGGICWYGDPTTTTGATSLVRNNVLYQNAGGGLLDLWCPGSPGCPSSSVNRFNASPSAADHNLTSNPSFVNPAGGNFQLQAGSSAINAGVTLTEVPVDALRLARPQGGTFDIGAYECTSSPAGPLPAPANFRLISSF